MADRRVSVSIDGDPSGYNRALLSMAARTKAFVRELDSADTRLANVTQTATALAPALVPIGAAAVPAIAGLTTQLGFAAAGAGVTALAFQGVGDALDAVNKYAIEPTTANFEAMQQAMATLGPAGQDLVLFLQDLRPRLQELQSAAQAGLFPGLEDGIRSLMTRLPQVESIITEISEATGDLLSEAGANLADPRWNEFFDYIETSARPILMDLGRTVGNVIEGFTDLWMAFDPLSQQFSDSLLGLSRDFADWADSVGETDGFAEFVDYIRTVGPQAWDTLGALANALLQVVEAAAPVGRAVLPVIETLADGLSLLANSPAGPALITTAAGLAACSRAVALFKAANASALVSLLVTSSEKGGSAGRGLTLMGKGAIAAAASMITLTEANKGLHFDDSSDEVARFHERIDGLASGPGGLQALRSELAAQQAVVDDALFAWQAFGVGIFSNDEADDAADRVEYLTGKIKALEDAKSEVDRGMGLSSLLVPDLELTADGFEAATDSADEFMASLQEVNGLLDKRAAFRNYRDSIRQLNAALDEAPSHMRKGSAAYDQVAGFLDAIAQNSLTAASHLTGMNRINFLDKARGQFVDAAMKLGKTREAAERLADKLNLLDRTDAKPEINPKGAKRAGDEIGGVQKKADKLGGAKIVPDLFLNDKASPGLKDVDRKLGDLDGTTANPAIRANDLASATITFVRNALASLNGDVATTYVRTIYQQQTKSDRMMNRAGGGYISGPGGPTDDLIPARLSNGEYVIRAAAVDRYGPSLFDDLNAMRFAQGGRVGGNLSLDQRLEVANLEQQIRQLRRDLAKDGKDALRGLEVKVAHLQLKAAQRDLRQARREPFTSMREGFRYAREGFDVSGDMSVKDVRGEIRDFRKDVREAGGRWTKRLDRMGDRLIANARKVNASERAIERETKRRDKISESLDEQQQAMENLRAEMEQFGSSVAGNFLSNPFGLSITPPAGSSAAPSDPALIAARDQLGAAEARLAGIRGRTDLDPLERSYLASRAVAEVANLRDQVEQLDRGSQGLADASQQAVTGVDALTMTLRDNISAVDSFIDSMSDLRGELAPGFYSQLALSGDVATAAQLAALPDEQVAEINALWLERQDKTAQLAAITTQQVYGQQQAILQAGIDKTAAALERQTRRVDHQTEVLQRRIDHVSEVTGRGLSSLAGQLGSIRQAVKDQPRQHRDNKRGGKGRG